MKRAATVTEIPAIKIDASRDGYHYHPTRALDGKEALDLYAAEFGRNLDAMSEHVVQLLAAFEERKELLGEIAASEGS